MFSCKLICVNNRYVSKECIKLKCSILEDKLPEKIILTIFTCNVVYHKNDVYQMSIIAVSAHAQHVEMNLY